MAITYVGSNAGTGTSISLPAHQAGDLILIFAVHGDGSGLTPSLPAGYTSIRTASQGIYFGRCGYKVATSSSETSGSWTNASLLHVVIYRGVGSSPIGASANTNGTTSTITYPALTMVSNAGGSWVVGFAQTNINGNTVDTPPSGMTNRTTLNPTFYGKSAAHDTNGGVSSWADHTSTVTNSGWFSFTVEILIDAPRTATEAVTDANDTVAATAVGATGSAALTDSDDVAGTAAVKGIGFVGANSAINANSVTLPAHQAGDCIVIFAWHNQSTTRPSLPAGFTDVAPNITNPPCAFRVGYKIAASASEASGTWTNANGIIAQVYRGTSVSPIGGTGLEGTSSSPITFPAVTLQNTLGDSWVVSFGGINSNSAAIEGALTGQVLRADVGNATYGEIVGYDTNGGVATWASQNTTGVSAAWLTFAFELIPARIARAAVTDADETLSTTTRGMVGTAAVTDADEGISGAASLAVTGAAAVADGSDSASAAGQLSLKAQGSATDADDSVSAAGALAIVGHNGGPIIDDDETISAAATVKITGQASVDDSDSVDATAKIEGAVADITEGDDQLAATGALAVTGQGSAADQDDNAVAAGALAISGVAAATDADDGLSSAAQVSAQGQVAATDDNEAISASGVLPVKGAASPVDDGDAVSAGATLPLKGQAAIAEADEGAAATGTLPLKGTAAATDGDEGIVSFAGATLGGAGAVTDADDTASASGKLAIGAAAAATEGDDTISAAGANTALGSAAITDADDSMAASGKVAITAAGGATDADEGIAASGLTGGLKFVWFDGTIWQVKTAYILTPAGWSLIELSSGG